MTIIKRSPHDFSITELDNELLARGARIETDERYCFKGITGIALRDEMMAQVKKQYQSETLPLPNDALKHLSMEQLTQALYLKIQQEESKKALRGQGLRLDRYEIADPFIQENASAVVSIWLKDNLTNTQDGFFALQLQVFGKAYNLNSYEPFFHQPVAVGRLCTGFLVKPDVIATAGHCVNKQNIHELCFIFGYEMTQAQSPVTRVPLHDVYYGVEILQRVYDPFESGADWALVKLQRPVSGRKPVILAATDVALNQAVYVLGHPVGLPLKYVATEPVQAIHNTYFSAQLSIYGGNSGSPVFSKDSHQLVGIVVRGDQQDFRWTGKGWLSIRYPNPALKSAPPQCTRVSQFYHYCR